MRPLRLTVQAFGPYAGHQVFDFGELLDRSLFLISGPTGAGKSTVLDAMCCALYGTTSGGDRKPQQMRSDHAARKDATEVRFDFCLGNRGYRVLRRLEHERPKKRGTGITVEAQKATIWERTGIDDPDAEGTPLATQWEKVTRKVEELLGFREDEFRQVVLLPQDRFRELLMADSRARESILTTLFGTGRYSAVERALKEACKAVEKRLEALKQNREGVLKVEGAASLDELQDQVAAVETESGDAAGLAVEAKAAKTRADEILKEAQRVHGLLDELKRARTALAGLEGRTGEMAATRKELERGRTARGLRDAEEDASRRAAEAGTARELADRAEGEQLRAAGELKAAFKKLEEERAREPRQAECQRRAALLDGLAERVAGIGEARGKVGSKEDETIRIGLDVEALRKDLNALEAEVAEGKVALVEAAGLAATLEAAELAKKQADGNLKQRRELKSAHENLSRDEKAHGKKHKALDAARERVGAAKAGLERAETARREGAASLLASGLAEGEPCPVCGSTNHPAPALPAGDLPDPSEFERLRDDLRTLEEALQKAEEREKEAAKQATGAKARVDQILENLGPVAEVGMDELERTSEEAGERVKLAGAAAGAVAGIEQAQTDREIRLADSAARHESLKLQAARAEADLEAARATLAERESAVPEEYRDPQALERERKRIAEELADMKGALEAAAKAHQDALGTLASREATGKAAKASAKATLAEAEARREAFLARVVSAGFGGEEEYTGARRTDEELTALEVRIEEWGGKLAAARDRVTRADEAATGLASPDLDSLRDAANQAGLASDAAAERAARLAEQAGKKRATLASLLEDAGEMLALERDFGVLGLLSETANGNNASKITFQRYVLGSLLDDVLVAATGRLKQMTAGRYLLQRTGGVGDRRRLAGLDLEVMDNFTGLARPVATLSGGESFLASLSLALGLADVVQAYAGGLHLETVFIDEGFGSLDPESLDMALRELAKLREGGRLVGIISHVPELRQRIDARLEITAGRTGSSARFVVG